MPPQPGCARGKVWLNPGQVHACARGRIVAVPLPPMRPVRGKEPLRVCPGVIVHSSPAPTRMHRFYVIFFCFERGWRGERKSPRNLIPPQC